MTDNVEGVEELAGKNRGGSILLPVAGRLTSTFLKAQQAKLNADKFLKELFKFV